MGCSMFLTWGCNYIFIYVLGVRRIYCKKSKTFNHIILFCYFLFSVDTIMC